MSQQSEGAVRRATSALRLTAPTDDRLLVVLVLVSVAFATMIWNVPDQAPLSTLFLPMLLGSLLLGPRHLPWFVVFVLALLLVVLTQQDTTARTTASVVVLFTAGLIILLMSFRRTRLGVGGSQGESMLVDLRDRILGQSHIPELPNGFHAESALRSAGGTPFAGDFVVAVRPPETDRFEVVVVDVSGKGEDAGTRALLLAGAFGGLIGALPAADFLPAANEYLLRQDWPEGFATAVHVSLDIGTGRFEIRNAGHPPAAHRVAGSGRWVLRSDQGPALGLLDGVDFPVVTGELRPGDALMMYTDGMVETAEKDIALGTDKMLGQSDQLLRGTFDGGAERLVRALGSRNDDRALVLLYRS